MVTPVVYPSTLPGPVASPSQSAERRIASALPGPSSSRAGQRDRHAFEELSFVFAFDQVAAFQAWWKDVLLEGGLWFASSWRQPQGGSGVRRFVGAPKWTEFIANVGWRMSATFEVRGRGLDPQKYPVPLLLMHFDGDLTDKSGGSFASTGGGAITTSTPKFGSGAWRNSAASAGRLVSNDRGGMNLGIGPWQLEGWVRVSTLSGNPSRVINLMALAGTGSTPGPGGDKLQLQVEINGSGEMSTVFSASDGTSTTVSRTGQPTVLISVDTWTHFAVVQDSYSIRTYFNGTRNAETIGATLYPSGFTHQGWVIGAGHAGGGWPGIYTNYLQGDVDELYCIREANYVGSSITVPTAPFVS